MARHKNQEPFSDGILKTNKMSYEVFGKCIRKCAVCGKELVILNPIQWTYRKQGKYYCSWGHFPKFRKKVHKWQWK